jgi:hypothetical protein
VSNGTIFIGSSQTTGAGILHLGGALNRTGAINIGNGANIANTSAINLSSTASAGIINVNRPLTITYLPSAITTTNVIGYSIVGTNITGSSFAANFNASTITIPHAGVYLFTTNMNLIGTSTHPGLFRLEGVGASLTQISFVLRTDGETGWNLNDTQIQICTASNYTLAVRTNSNTFSSVTGFFKATRIA